MPSVDSIRRESHAAARDVFQPLPTQSILSQISPRLQRMRLCVDPYDYEVVYRPGSELVLADSLSRASLRDNDIDVNDNEYVKKGKGSFYIAQYPVRWIAQSALHFLPSMCM